jgi:hypothetical protein
MSLLIRMYVIRMYVICFCRREVQVISLVNYELLYLTGLNLTRSETDVIQVFAVCNGRVTVTGRTHPHTWKAEMADR